MLNIGTPCIMLYVGTPFTMLYIGTSCIMLYIGTSFIMLYIRPPCIMLFHLDTLHNVSHWNILSYVLYIWTPYPKLYIVLTCTKVFIETVSSNLRHPLLNSNNDTLSKVLFWDYLTREGTPEPPLCRQSLRYADRASAMQ